MAAPVSFSVLLARPHLSRVFLLRKPFEQKHIVVQIPELGIHVAYRRRKIGPMGQVMPKPVYILELLELELKALDDIFYDLWLQDCE
jgi:hypothetical protein